MKHTRRQARPSLSPRKKEIAQVALHLGEQRSDIGKLMADAFEKVGKDGVITVEEGKTSETTLEFVEGMQFDKGYISPYFVINHADLKCDDGRRAAS